MPAKLLIPIGLNELERKLVYPFAHFTAQVLRDERGFPFEVALLIEESLGGEIRGEVCRLEAMDRLECFILSSKIVSLDNLNAVIRKVLSSKFYVTRHIS